MNVIEPLVQALEEKNLAVIGGAYRFFIRLGKSGAENLLIDALEEYGCKIMAEDYLNCGNIKLDNAARGWAEKRGYKIVLSPSYSGPKWGESIK